MIITRSDELLIRSVVCVENLHELLFIRQKERNLSIWLLFGRQCMGN